MQITTGSSAKSSKLFLLSAHVPSNRSWSLAVRNHNAPEIYVGVLSSSPTKRDCAILQLKKDWQRLVRLEQRRATLGPARDLWNDLISCKYNVVRLMYCAFERDQFRSNSIPGCRLLHAMLDVLPDNKLVEDGHNDMRKDSKRTCLSKKRAYYRFQNVLGSESLFEKRGIQHTAKLTRAYFTREYKETFATSEGFRFESRSHKMRRRWYRILGAKRWQTIS